MVASDSVEHMDQGLFRDTGTHPWETLMQVLGEDAGSSKARICTRISARVATNPSTVASSRESTGGGVLKIRGGSPMELFELRECNTYTKR